MDWIGVKPRSKLHCTESQFLPQERKLFLFYTKDRQLVLFREMRSGYHTKWRKALRAQTAVWSVTRDARTCGYHCLDTVSFT